MLSPRRIALIGGLAASAVAATPFAWLWYLQARTATPPPDNVRVDIAIWTAVFATPAILSAWLLWRAWWRRHGARLSALDGPGWLLAGAAATLPPGRRDWGVAMAAELAQVPDRAARWRFAAGCVRAAVFPPWGNRRAVGATGALAAAAVGAAALATGAALPAGRVFALAFIGVLGGLATLGVARSQRLAPAGPGLAIAGPVLVGVAACLAFTVYYLAEHPTYDDGSTVSLPPLTAVVLAVALTGCLGLALRPPGWLLPDRPARWFAVTMAIALVGGSLLVAQLFQLGLMGYVLGAAILVVLPGSAAAAAMGRSFRSGLSACAWTVVGAWPLLVAVWLAEGLRWDRAGLGAVLDGEGPFGAGVNVGDAVWWTLPYLILWAVPLGVLGAIAGSWRPRRRRARQHADPAPAP